MSSRPPIKGCDNAQHYDRVDGHISEERESLKLETHHRGSYLLVRAITPLNRMTGVLALVEDERRKAILLQLHQQEEEHIRAATDIVNEGTILIIRELHFKVMASGGYSLRVDHLSDMIYLEIGDGRVPKAWRPQFVEIGESAVTLKLKGNAFVRQGKYSKALSRPATSQEVDIIQRNRSLAYLKAKQYDIALSGTGYPSFGKECSEKALFRATEALYHLTRFEDYLKVFGKLYKNFPSNKQAVVVLERTKCRCLEKSSGGYNFKHLQAEAKKLHPPHLDHATYIGPVEVRRTEHKGRGLFATKKMNTGDVILCEKAFAHAYVADGGNATLTFLMNIQTNKGFMGGQADLMRMLVQKLYYNPSLATAFTELHHGSYKKADTAFVDGQPVVDTLCRCRRCNLRALVSLRKKCKARWKG
ncbi:hypothetical protein GQ44DRAFT_783133 [Phaeosphaeriaceae sp. PMI808]|nr:hypothetical protein GQ44DRAFT_783133 [Phaeosphaeriaceae sp. PMI808]